MTTFTPVFAIFFVTALLLFVIVACFIAYVLYQTLEYLCTLPVPGPVPLPAPAP